MWKRVYLGLGSNLGDRKKNIEQAISMLEDDDRIRVLKISRLDETEPAGGPPQGMYLNGAIRIETTFNPRELLNYIKMIERHLGRVDGPENSPRPIDLDILLFEGVGISEDDLTIPHERMFEREFVKRPLREILSDDRLFSDQILDKLKTI